MFRHCYYGTILHTEDLCEEETEKFNIKPMYESLSSISSSNSTLDSNNLDNHDKVQVKKDENNSDETLDNFIGIKNHVFIPNTKVGPKEDSP
jgi:hypothetical protein